METALKKVADEGFLRKMKTENEQYAINRITKVFVNVDVMNDSLEKLETYAEIQNN